MNNLAQYHCNHCEITHMVCKEISPAACEQKCEQCTLTRHVFMLKGKPVFCVTEEDMDAFMDMYRR